MHADVLPREVDRLKTYDLRRIDPHEDEAQVESTAARGTGGEYVANSIRYARLLPEAALVPTDIDVHVQQTAPLCDLW